MLLLGLTYFVYPSSGLAGYVLGAFVVGVSLYFIRWELRWLSISDTSARYRGFLLWRRVRLDEITNWTVVSGGVFSNMWFVVLCDDEVPCGARKLRRACSGSVSVFVDEAVASGRS